MRKEILYTTALDSNGNLIHVDSAEKGISYYCPSCKTNLTLKKSGNKGKGSKRPHFSHKSVTENCTPEGVLHLSFKKFTIKLIQDLISEKKPIPIQWNCSSCGNQNSGNLIIKVQSVKEEYYLGECRPDIALLDGENNVLVVIEIVVTHEPENQVLEYYKENRITLIQINVTSDEDLKLVSNKLMNPDIVNYCFNAKCPNISNYSHSRFINSYIDRCGGCLQSIEKFRIGVISPFKDFYSSDFTGNEIIEIKDKRKNIKIIEDKKTGQERPISVCQRCKMIRSRYRRGRR